MSVDRVSVAYSENVGRDPVTRYPDDHPAAWEWEYRGTAEEREGLAERLGLASALEGEQESLFS